MYAPKHKNVTNRNEKTGLSAPFAVWVYSFSVFAGAIGSPRKYFSSGL